MMKINKRSKSGYFSGNLVRPNTVMNQGPIPYRVWAWVQMTKSNRKKIGDIRILAWDPDDAIAKCELELHRKNKTGKKLQIEVKDMIT